MSLLKCADQNDRGFFKYAQIFVRWYVAYSLSYRDIEELALERGLKVDHSTVNRWVIAYASGLEASFRSKYKRQTGLSWRMDETHIKMKGIWVYLYRAVDKAGIDTVNLFLFALFLMGMPYQHVEVRQVKYLNNLVEQDHRFIKKITQPMRGFKAFHSAKATLAGIELHHMFRKGQHKQSANLSIFDHFYQLAA